mgnify:CR=1 FL=1
MARLVNVAGDEARAAGLPLIVHATGLREAKAALAAGAKVLVHSVDDSAGGRRVPPDWRSATARSTARRSPCARATCGCTNRRAQRPRAQRSTTPTVRWIRSPARLIASTPVEAAADGASSLDRGLDRSRAGAVRTMAENLRARARAGIPIAMGTDAGNPLTLHGPAVFAEMEAMQPRGHAPMQVLVAATRGRRHGDGPRREFGTLEAGKQADLVVLEGDPSRDVRAWRKLRYVVRGGVVRTPRELRAP